MSRLENLAKFWFLRLTVGVELLKFLGFPGMTGKQELLQLRCI